MTRRKGIIAALAGIFPALGAFGQDKYGNISVGASSLTRQANPHVTFYNGTTNVADFSWDLDKSQLVIRMDGREQRISPKEIMDALEGK